jgi:hypothetical protein
MQIISAAVHMALSNFRYLWRSMKSAGCATRMIMSPTSRPSVDRAHDQIRAIERGAVQGLLEVTTPGGFARIPRFAILKPAS